VGPVVGWASRSGDACAQQHQPDASLADTRPPPSNDAHPRTLVGSLKHVFEGWCGAIDKERFVNK
jgi:hypothetical protein